VQLKSANVSANARRRPCRNRPQVIQANHFEQITTADIAQHIAAQVRSKGLAPKTANRFREVLTRLFNWAMQQHGIRTPENVNPAAKVERYKEKAPQISFLNREQIEAQLKALEDKPRLQAMVALYIYAGVRREEALWLTRKDVDLEAGVYGMLRIRAKTIGGEHWQPKTGVNRIVPISSTLRKYLDRYEPQKVEGGWYFPSPRGTRWNADNFSADLRKENKAAGLAWACLDYRHTFGSHLAMKGESLYKISKLMGNSPEICRRHYAALVPEEMAGVVEF